MSPKAPPFRVGGTRLQAVALVLVVAALGGAMRLLWRSRVIELPAVVIHGAGRVAGVMTARGMMDVHLPVPFHRQEHSLSCEIAALKMALEWYDLEVSESALLAALPFDPTPKGGGVWGDPDQGFVGNIDGEMLITGYGVYAEPIARLGLRWRRTEVLKRAVVSDLAVHVAAGHPVIVWGYYGRPFRAQWETPAGRVITAVNGEHTRVVTGFRGPVEAPTHFALLDPLYGELVWTTDQLERNWDALGRMAVVVY